MSTNTCTSTAIPTPMRETWINMTTTIQGNTVPTITIILLMKMNPMNTHIDKNF